MADPSPNRSAASARRARGTATAVLCRVAAAWNGAGILYAVANGLENYPHRLGRDLDVLVAPGQLRQASQIVHTTLQQCGRRVVVRRRRELVQHIGTCPRGGDTVILDLFPGLRWGPTRLVELPSVSGSLDCFAIDPWASFVKRILLHVLVAPRAKFSAAPERLVLADAERLAASTRLPPLVGHRLAGQTLAAIQHRSIARLEVLRPRLRRALIVRTFLRSPLQAIRSSGGWLRERLSLMLCPSAMPTLTVVGPDGVGKSTLIAEIARLARRRLRCTRVEVRHWRPGLLPQLSTFLGRPAPEAGTPPRRTAGRLGWLRILYYSTDFVLGSWSRDRRISRDLGLVVYDRHALDMCVDPLRYGLRPSRALDLLVRLLPRPDLTVLLRDDAPRIRQRKSELEETEIRRQLERWMELVAAGQVDLVLQVDAPPAVMAERVVARLTELFLARHGIAPA